MKLGGMLPRSLSWIGLLVAAFGVGLLITPFVLMINHEKEVEEPVDRAIRVA